MAAEARDEPEVPAHLIPCAGQLSEEPYSANRSETLDTGSLSVAGSGRAPFSRDIDPTPRPDRAPRETTARLIKRSGFPAPLLRLSSLGLSAMVRVEQEKRFLPVALHLVRVSFFIVLFSYLSNFTLLESFSSSLVIFVARKEATELVVGYDCLATSSDTPVTATDSSPGDEKSCVLLPVPTSAQIDKIIMLVLKPYRGNQEKSRFQAFFFVISCMFARTGHFITSGLQPCGTLQAFGRMFGVDVRIIKSRLEYRSGTYVEQEKQALKCPCEMLRKLKSAKTDGRKTQTEKRIMNQLHTSRISAGIIYCCSPVDQKLTGFNS
ncbi:hypothetical protein RRG08_027479 [Elysia crispata]|uniref:Uncharacterized protein n=1 Tax=Elysia crispata TaxID=231223 RepID=A0AAE1D3Y3_9GAST|nr:hypothetical protein RRG08_027479 [Elysia crispata]